jgi:two-component system sensor histidine kinase YesM
MGGSVFSVGQAIRGDYDNILGIMSIDVEMGLLDRICNDIRLGKTGYVMLVDGNGRIIYHPKAELIGKPVSFLLGKPLSNEWETSSLASQIGHGNQAVTKNFAMANWRIIGVSNQAELAREMQKATGLTLALIICSIFVVIVVALFLANLLTRPIKELQLSMRLASEDLNTNVVVRTNDEIGQLGEAFNQMLARIRQLMEQGVQEQKKLRRTEMIALQEQIKPHFIYNTLDLIIGLLETNKNEDVIKMVEALGAFFRISLSHGQEFITIRDEVEHIRNYLYLQRFRHGEKYDYRLEVDAWLLERKTIKLILQPLVENAIYHGVRELERQDGLISVKGYHSEGQAYFEVIDNGLGMSPEKVEEINNLLHGNVVYAGEQRYFGLRNVNERIVLAFGKEYGLSITSTLGRGTRVVVHLPLI